MICVPSLLYLLVNISGGWWCSLVMVVVSVLVLGQWGRRVVLTVRSLVSDGTERGIWLGHGARMLWALVAWGLACCLGGVVRGG